MNTPIKFFLTVAFVILLFACGENNSNQSQPVLTDTAASRTQIASMLDSLNVAAAKADFDGYFNYFAEDATFLGTDATEKWSKKNFMAYAKPYFDKKTTWNFTSVERTIYFGKQNDIAWFDELLSTQMKLCRGSGVVVKQHNEWKVQQYVLSMTIPNNYADEVIRIKSAAEDSLLQVKSER